MFYFYCLLKLEQHSPQNLLPFRACLKDILRGIELGKRGLGEGKYSEENISEYEEF